MKMFKKNQIIIYVIVLMLMTAGYLNYTTNTEKQEAVETSMQTEESDEIQLADIGDATLVNSNEIVTENETTSNTTNMTNTNTLSNTTNIMDTNTLDNDSTSNYTTSDNTVVPTSSETTSNDYFVKSKLERDTMYSQMLETYEKVLNSTNSLETQRQSATQEIQKINETKNSIMICENLIKTKGFENNVVFVNGQSISVIIGKEDMKQEEVAQIQNIIAREMKAEIENIHIGTKK